MYKFAEKFYFIKIARVLSTFLLVGFLSFLTFMASDGEANSEQNVDLYWECVLNRDCIQDATQQYISSGSDPKNWRLSRWHQPVSIKVFGEQNADYKEELESILMLYDSYFPGKVVIDQNKWNIFVFFTDDIQRDVKRKYNNFLSKNFNLTLNLDDNKKINAGDRCIPIKIKNREFEIIAAILFVDTDEAIRSQCIKEGVANILASHITSNFQIPSSQDSDNQADITKLDLFFMAMLYDPNFQTGMSQKQFSNVFDKAYADSLNRFTSNLKVEIL